MQNHAQHRWNGAGLLLLLCLLCPPRTNEAAGADHSRRIAAALAAQNQKATDTVFFAVPAMSTVMRLSDSYPEDGRLLGDLRIVAAQDEFEPASFLLYSAQGQRRVTLTVSPLAGPDGASIPADRVDLKVVKIWYQNGNAWISYFSDVGLKLVPELLLYDETLIRVDTEEEANYARVDYPDGSKHVWISGPKHLSDSYRLEGNDFHPVSDPFADASTLQPVTLAPGRFKQFFATLHVPPQQTPGVYTGTITVAAGGKTLTTIPLKVRVLPFALPLPRPYYDIDEHFIVSIMGGARLTTMMKLFDGDRDLAMETYRAFLINQKNHGILHPCVDQTEESIKLVKELGFPTKPFMGKSFAPWFALNFGGRMTFDNKMAAKVAARRCSEFYQKHLGHNDVLVDYGDEQGTAFVTTHRNFYQYYQEYGIKMGCAGHDALLYKGGYTYEIHPMGGAPDEIERIRPWREIGGKYVGFYAGQHTGSENPQFVRRQHGMLGYLSNLNLVWNYEFALGPWNDRANSLYKPMVLAYLNRGGLVDTLQWEGFREGIDDIRYATKLKQMVRDAVESGNIRRKLEGKKALQYLALLKGAEMDLDEVRAEIIEFILKLDAMARTGGAQ